VRLAAASPRLWPHVEQMAARARPDCMAALAATTPDRLRIPLLVGLTPVDARADDNYALRVACGNGHVAVAQWLTAADARAGGNWALRWGQANGQLAMARWLVDRFGITKDEAGTNLVLE
jgi:hypothetical protein